MADRHRGERPDPGMELQDLQGDLLREDSMNTTLMTINTIELSSKCDMACLYCVNRLMEKNGQRVQQIMREDVFKLTLEVIRDLVDQGTQREINLNGNGESTLDPDLPRRAEMVIKVAKGRPVSFCTNGKSMTKQLAIDLKNAGIRRVDLSTHSAYHARRAADILQEIGIAGVVNAGAITGAHNWAGQLEPEHSVQILLDVKCDPLIEGRGYVQAEGFVSPCCYDYRNLGTIGAVWDDDIIEREVKPYALCKTCHQHRPEEVTEC